MKGSPADPNKLDMKVIDEAMEARDKERCDIAMKVFRVVCGMKPESTHKDIAEKQWLEIFHHVTAAVAIHCKTAGMLNVGLYNDTLEPELDRMSRISIGYILELSRRATCVIRTTKT